MRAEKHKQALFVVKANVLRHFKTRVCGQMRGNVWTMYGHTGQGRGIQIHEFQQFRNTSTIPFYISNEEF